MATLLLALLLRLADVAPPAVLVVPSAAPAAPGEPSAGSWSRGLARLVARELGTLKGHEGRVSPLLTLGVREGALGFVVPPQPLSLREALAVGRAYKASFVASLHVDPQQRKVFLDVVDVRARESRFARTYDWTLTTEPPPLARVQKDLGVTTGIAVREPDLARAAWAQTQSLPALEAFVGGLDSLLLETVQRDRSLGKTQPSRALFAAALAADPNFAEARRLRDEGARARFDRLVLREIKLDTPKPPPKKRPKGKE